ncbi:MAG: translation initiation factor IF-3 [Planctomycetota bacterium]
MSQDRGPRINHQIRIREVRVIDEDNKQLGILQTADALALAIQKQLDLVEIAPNQRPPVCRIMDFGKYQSEEQKKEQASRRTQHQVHITALRVRPVTGEHDLQVKIKQARQFFADGDKVLVCCVFKGRQITHKEVGEQVINEVVKELSDIAKIEAGIRVEGKRMVLLLTKK